MCVSASLSLWIKNYNSFIKINMYKKILEKYWIKGINETIFTMLSDFLADGFLRDVSVR